jgi:DNA-binding CsgD family transcriptional regulator
MTPLRLALVPAAALAALSGFDLWREGGGSRVDVALDLAETALLVGAMVAIAFAAARLTALGAETRAMRDRLDRALVQGAEWRASRAAEIAALGEAIRVEFRAWGLTPAEADVAGLLLKGAAMKEIALARDTSEATIRQQAQAIYRKSGLGGRAELQAYFLDGLFAEAEERRLRVVP